MHAIRYTLYAIRYARLALFFSPETGVFSRNPFTLHSLRHVAPAQIGFVLQVPFALDPSAQSTLSVAERAQDSPPEAD